MDSLFYFSFLKERNSQRTIFWNTKILKKVPGTAHYYNLTPCFRYYPINVCKAAINLVSNSRLHAELPKWRGNEWVESSEIGCRGSDIKDPRPVHYGTSEEVRRLPWSLRIIGLWLQSFLISPESGSTDHMWGGQRYLAHWVEELNVGMSQGSPLILQNSVLCLFFLTVLLLLTLTRSVSAPDFRCQLQPNRFEIWELHFFKRL